MKSVSRNARKYRRTLWEKLLIPSRIGLAGCIRARGPAAGFGTNPSALMRFLLRVSEEINLTEFRAVLGIDLKVREKRKADRFAYPSP